MKPITVLSLFNGMSVGYMALKNAGIPVQKYYSSEIDKFAIAESQANFPDIIQLGDVTKWKEWDIDWSSIDLLMGGSPCTDVSFAGKQEGLIKPDSNGNGGTRSGLFYVMMDIFNHIKELNPNLKFLFENVKMKKEHLDEFTKFIGVEPVLINSELYTAHYRQRYYWVSTDKLILNPTYKAPVLQDILEDGWYSDRKKSYCIDANYWKKGDISQYRLKSRRQIVFRTEDYKLHDTNYLIENYKLHIDYRHLTVTECCKLQGVDISFFKVSSKTQAYKMLGNGWTVPVIEHLLREIFF